MTLQNGCKLKRCKLIDEEMACRGAIENKLIHFYFFEMHDLIALFNVCLVMTKAHTYSF